MKALTYSTDSLKQKFNLYYGWGTADKTRGFYLNFLNNSFKIERKENFLFSQMDKGTIIHVLLLMRAITIISVSLIHSIK